MVLFFNATICISAHLAPHLSFCCVIVLQLSLFRYLRVNPLLQSVPELLGLDWLSQGAEGGLELSDGRRQVVEPTACTGPLLQQPSALGCRVSERVSR